MEKSNESLEKSNETLEKSKSTKASEKEEFVPLIRSITDDDVEIKSEKDDSY